ncbi:MAG: J domain-containing protein [Alphaproteobacteria bacterium]|nr:J domain-containing protein [Alphaproteobacteria bacterium]
MADLYDIIGVPRGASQDEIKKAFRKRAKDYHPDRNPGDPKLAERFKELNAAYSILGDEKMRGRYDRGEIDAQGQERSPFRNHRGGRRAGAGPGGGGFRFDFGPDGPEDIFSEIFSGFRGGRAGAGRAARARGADVEYKLSIGFLEAARGGTKPVTLPSGRTLNVRIPPGIGDGQQIRLKGQGEAGIAGGAPGDALIEIAVEPHPFFQRKGNDVHVELPVSLGEAVLGAKIAAPTIHGMVNVTVPKGSNTGTVLRLRGKGIPAHGERPEGDQYVRLKIVLPDKPDLALERFVRDWPGAQDETLRSRFRIE